MRKKLKLTRSESIKMLKVINSNPKPTEKLINAIREIDPTNFTAEDLKDLVGAIREDEESKNKEEKRFFGFFF